MRVIEEEKHKETAKAHKATEEKQKNEDEALKA